MTCLWSDVISPFAQQQLYVEEKTRGGEIMENIIFKIKLNNEKYLNFFKRIIKKNILF